MIYAAAFPFLYCYYYFVWVFMIVFQSNIQFFIWPRGSMTRFSDWLASDFDLETLIIICIFFWWQISIVWDRRGSGILLSFHGFLPKVTWAKRSLLLLLLLIFIILLLIIYTGWVIASPSFSLLLVAISWEQFLSLSSAFLCVLFLWFACFLFVIRYLKF